MRQDGEPSVDQLLQSIKKVMAREPRPAAPLAEQRATDPAAPAEPSLAAIAGAPGPRPEPATQEEADELDELAAPAPAADYPGEQDAEGPARADDDGLIEDEADGEAEPPAGASETEPPCDPLLSAETTAQVRRALAALAALADPDAPDTPNLAGGVSLEATVREVLRPLLAQWLETHLPAIVERELKAELARLRGDPQA